MNDQTAKTGGCRRQGCCAVLVMLALLLLVMFINPLFPLKALSWIAGSVKGLIPDKNRIASRVDVRWPSWSPDARYLYYIRANVLSGYTVRRYDVRRQKSRSLAEIRVADSSTIPSLAPSADATQLFVGYDHRIDRLDIARRRQRLFYRSPIGTSLGWVTSAGDGRLIVTISDSETSGHERIVWLSKQGVAERIVPVRQPGDLVSLQEQYIVQDKDSPSLLRLCDSRTGATLYTVHVILPVAVSFDVIGSTQDAAFLWYYDSILNRYRIDRVDFPTGKRVTMQTMRAFNECYAVTLSPDAHHLSLTTGGGTEWPEPSYLYVYDF